MTKEKPFKRQNIEVKAVKSAFFLQPYKQKFLINVEGEGPEIGQVYKDSKLNYSFYLSSTAWRVCEAQKAFIIDNRLAVNPSKCVFMIDYLETACANP